MCWPSQTHKLQTKITTISTKAQDFFPRKAQWQPFILFHLSSLWMKFREWVRENRYFFPSIFFFFYEDEIFRERCSSPLPTIAKNSCYNLLRCFFELKMKREIIQQTICSFISFWDVQQPKSHTSYLAIYRVSLFDKQIRWDFIKTRIW